MDVQDCTPLATPSISPHHMAYHGRPSIILIGRSSQDFLKRVLHLAHKPSTQSKCQVCRGRYLKHSKYRMPYNCYNYCVWVLFCVRILSMSHIKKKTNKNKAISMMRGKSPPSDLEMSKPLNFVAAILDLWRPSWIDNGYLISLYSI